MYDMFSVVCVVACLMKDGGIVVFVVSPLLYESEGYHELVFFV